MNCLISLKAKMIKANELRIGNWVSKFIEECGNEQ